jgi:hypothetical protein
VNDTVRQFRDFFVSLKLTVVLLVLSMGLVFIATLDQVNLGIWAVQAKYFHSLFVLWNIPGTDVPLPVYPGGYLIGGFLLVNLVAAHVYRFKLEWRKTGVLLVHTGLILLLVGEFLTGILQEEYQMALNEGETKNFSESYRYNELAIIDTTDPKFDDVVAVPEALLKPGSALQHPKLPFRVVTKEYYPNAVLGMRTGAAGETPSLATAGVGPQINAAPIPLTYKQDERNWPVVFVELVGPEGSLGTWLLSPQLPAPQTFEYGGHSWRLALRFQRAYKPFTLTLLKFSHDLYHGTDIPKNYSSRLKLTTPDGQEDREVLIYMNNPLRYAGLTFYQASFDPSNDHNTILQVVRNPGWLLPYLSCVLMTLGLVVQFGIHLLGFIRKRRAAGATP